jgi:hypothetical protein
LCDLSSHWRWRCAYEFAPASETSKSNRLTRLQIVRMDVALDISPVVRTHPNPIRTLCVNRVRRPLGVGNPRLFVSTLTPTRRRPPHRHRD